MQKHYPDAAVAAESDENNKNNISPFNLNLIGYLLTNMACHSDQLVEGML